MTQSRQSRGDDDEDMHETETEGIKNEESIRYGSPPPSPPQPQPQGTTATSSFHSILNSPSAADILRPLSTVAAQRSFPLPTSGSLASLARRHQHDHADGRRISEDSEPTSPTNSSSLTHERLLQSDSVMDATTRPDLSNLDDVGARSAAAVREFTAVVWDTSSRTMTTTSTTETKPIQGVSAYSSSPPFSSPTSSLAEGSSDPLEEEDDQQRHIFASPFASIFPEGTNTITPLIIRRYDDNNNNDDDDDHDHDDSNNNDDAADADHRTIFKYSESIQLFRRRPEDGGKTWKRRVLEYR